MAKQKNNLLGATNPERLRDISIGTILAVFVFFGSFVVGDSAVFLIRGESTLSASAFRCSGWYCLENDSDGQDPDDNWGDPENEPDDVPGDVPPSDPYDRGPVDYPDPQEEARINDALRELDDIDGFDTVPVDPPEPPPDTPIQSAAPSNYGN